MSRTRSSRPTLGRAAAAAAGPAFVGLVLAGNSLTESAVASARESADGPAAEAVAAFAGYASSGTAQAGLVVELLAFTCLLVFAGYLGALFLRRRAAGTAAMVGVLAVLTMLAVKLGSGAALLAGVARHEELSPQAALALAATNDVAFVLAWLPFAVFVLATALGLGRAGVLGRVGVPVGVVVGALGLAAALAGALTPLQANPVPFLLGLVWTLAVGLKLTVAEARGRMETAGAVAPAGIAPSGAAVPVG